MYNFNGNYIDPGDIVAVESHTTKDEAYPYGLRVHMKSTQSIPGVKYTTQKDRDNEARYINNAVDNQRAQTNRVESEIRDLTHEIDCARRDIRELKRLIKTGESGR